MSRPPKKTVPLSMEPYPSAGIEHGVHYKETLDCQNQPHLFCRAHLRGKVVDRHKVSLMIRNSEAFKLTLEVPQSRAVLGQPACRGKIVVYGYGHASSVMKHSLKGDIIDIHDARLVHFGDVTQPEKMGDGWCCAICMNLTAWKNNRFVNGKAAAKAFLNDKGSHEVVDEDKVEGAPW